MIRPKCKRCKKELQEPGALIFSPSWDANRVAKNHLCTGCYSILADWLEGERKL